MFDSFKELVVTADQFEQVRQEVTDSNRRALDLFSPVTAVLMAGMIVLLLTTGQSRQNVALYGGMCLISLIVYGLTQKGSDRWIMPCVHVFTIMLFAFGLVLGTFGNPERSAVTFMVLLIAVPLMFGERPIRMNFIILLAVGGFIISCSLAKQAQLVFADTVNVLTFGVLALVTNTYMMKIKMERYLYEHEMRLSYEYDRLTGLRSRNIYEEKLEQLAELFSEKLMCIYLDVDGLHELNNTSGHKAGDEMLIFVAERFRDHFDPECTYRIGGDEYVALLPDTDTDEAIASIEQIKKDVEAAGYHVSVGYCVQKRENFDRKTILNDAEQMMYAGKRAYYSRRGNDRRVRE